MVKHYLNCVGSIDEGSNFDNSMVKRDTPYWGLGSFSGIANTINADLERGETVIMWLRPSRKSCKKKYGDERFVGAFKVTKILKREVGPLIALDPTNEELGWRGGNWEFIIHYSKYFNISALQFGASKTFGLPRYPQVALCCLNTMRSLETNRASILTMLDNLSTSLPHLGCTAN